MSQRGSVDGRAGFSYLLPGVAVATCRKRTGSSSPLAEQETRGSAAGLDELASRLAALLELRSERAPLPRCELSRQHGEEWARARHVGAHE